VHDDLAMGSTAGLWPPAKPLVPLLLAPPDPELPPPRLPIPPATLAGPPTLWLPPQNAVAAGSLAQQVSLALALVVPP